MRNEGRCKTVLVKNCPLHFLLRRDDSLAGKPFHDDPALPAPTQGILASMRHDHPNLSLMAQYIKYLSETISGKEHALPF